MNEQQKAQAGEIPAEQQTGIFETNNPVMKKAPLSGKQLSIRIIICTALVVLGFVLYFVISDSYQSPIKKYYKGYEKNDISAMEKAFPEWLRKANNGNGAITIKEMCQSMLSMKKLNYGDHPEITMGIIGKEKVSSEKLKKIEKGIEAKYRISASVTAGWDCILDVTYKKESGEEIKMLEYATVYKINGSWYMLDVATNSRGEQ